VKKFIILGCLIFSVLNIFAKDEPVLKIIPSKVNVAPGEVFQISVEITGVANASFNNVENIDESIKINTGETMSSFSFVNGVTTSSLTINFYVEISKEGNINIGPFVFNISGKQYKTESVKINVSKNNKNISKKQNEDEDTDEHDAEIENYNVSGNKNLNYLIKLDVSKKEVFVNEYFDVSVKFYARQAFQDTGYEAVKLPVTSWVEKYDIKNTSQRRVNINNLTYQEFEVERKKVFISKDGIVNISPAVLKIIGLVGNGFFAEQDQLSLKTEAASIKVKPLPSNSPSGFNGIVGNFKVNSEFNTGNLKVKDPATLKISITGDGNFQDIKDIGYKINNKGIDEYSAKSNITTSGNEKTKTWEILLVPSNPGKYKIKVDDFSYFDLKKKSYITIKGSEYSLNVAKSDNENVTDQSVIINNNTNLNTFEPLNDIKFIKTSLGLNSKILNYNFYFVIIVLIYVSTILFVLIYLFSKYIIFNRQINKHIIRKRNSYKVFTSSIMKVKNNINKEKIDKIPDELFVILENYFVSKFGIDSVDFTKNGIQEKLSIFLSREDLENLKKIFVELDMFRFGGIDLVKEDLKKLIENIIILVKHIEG
jgi:hypothetical protein